MKLLTLKLVARGANGWESPTLQFGDRSTLVYAPNGSGKTPIVQAIAFCLGYPVTFREDVKERCAAASLEIDIDGNILELRRTLQKDFHIAVKASGGGVKQFFSEGDFSKALFETLKLQVPLLVSTSKEATRPFISTVLPVFYLNQDSGYSQAYFAPRPFISDQFVEMVRFVFGLSPKHSYQVKKDLLAAKDELEAVTRKIVHQQKVLADLSISVDDKPETVAAIERQSEELQRQLQQLRESMSFEGSAKSALTDALSTKDDELRATRRAVEELRQRITGIDGIQSEIEAEAQTLSLNEESKRLFESFHEICRNPDCGLFIGSAESYAKNLLYLKDQLKDLQRNADHAKLRLSDMEGVLRRQEAERAELVGQIGANGASSGVDQLVAAVQQATLAVFAVEQKRGSLRVFTEERSKYFRFEAERDRIQDKIANLTVSGRSDVAFNKLRLSLKDLIVRWLDILKTLNVSRDVEIDLEFRFKFGNEALEAITGSTRIRVVLAIHAALLELYLRDAEAPFRFIILDTPKQQEMQTRDLADFLMALSELCGNFNAQLIFSSTEYHFPVETRDAEWNPTYPGPRQPMFLGLPSD